MRRLVPAICALAVAAACGGGSEAFQDPFPAARSIEVPKRLAGMDVRLAGDATKQLKETGKTRSYVGDAWVYSVRLDKELKAIYEVIRLSDDARPGDREFRRDILAQIGGTLERPERVGDTAVYEGSQNEQKMFMWFEGRFLQILVVRAEETVQDEGIGFDPQDLLFEAVSLRPA